MIAVIAKLSIKEDKVNEAVALVSELVAQVGQEKDTLAYSMNIEKQNPGVIVMIERYRDLAALKHHSETPYFKDFFARIGPMLSAKPAITILDEIKSI
jgi:quinol monooxygenase YgiN